MVKLFGITIILALTGCSSVNYSQETTKQFTAKKIPNAFKKSYQDWLKLKKKHGSSYSYERDSNITAQLNSSTKFDIINNKVESRHFFQWQTGNTPSLTWSESYGELNSHNQGVATHTIDELYDQCRDKVLNKPQPAFNVIFQVDQLNVLKQCSYTLLSCSEKCTKGIRIQGLTIKHN